MKTDLINKIVKLLPEGLPDSFFADLQQSYHNNLLEGYLSMRQYCLAENISRGTAYYRIRHGAVKIKKIGNLTYLKNK